MNATADSRTIAFVNAQIAGFGRGVLRICGEWIVSVGARARRGDQVVDVLGERLLPGLINAHDHLHRNHYPRLKYRASHDNAREWAADIDARRHVDLVLIGCAAVPRNDALQLGALKNLLSGVTTVVHHDAPHPALESPAFPLRVPSRYGWAHSLADGADRIRDSHRATPGDAPWFIHAGEGTDAAAADEAAQLDALQVLTSNTVLVHGVAFDAAVRARLIERGVGLIWCPGSNHFLYGRTAVAGEFAGAGLLALGSDSRLSGERDLLDELHFAQVSGEVGDAALESLVTTAAARLLRLPDRGTLRAGAVADLIVLPRDARLWEVRRADLRCVLVRGAMGYGDQDYAEHLIEPESRVPFMVDGRRKWLAAAIASGMAGAVNLEKGCERAAAAVRAA